MTSSIKDYARRGIPCRVLLSVLLCFGTLNLYAQRMCFSIAVLCMTNHTSLLNTTDEQHQSVSTRQQNTSATGCERGNLHSTPATADGPFAWDSSTRGMILGVFFWGYLVGQIPLSILTQRYGCRNIACMNLLLLSASTILTPLAANTHIYILYALRVFAGIASSGWFSAFYQLWAAWAPPGERGLLVGVAYSGLHIGNAVALPLTAALCQSYYGWKLIFYVYGAASFGYTLLWMFMVYDTPQQHPRISKEELQMLTSHCGHVDRSVTKFSNVPLRAILTSIPVWAFVAVNMGFDWNGYTFSTSIPTYMQEALQFDIAENAGLSALPFISIWVGQLISGWISDTVIARNLLSVNIVRKLMTSIGMFTPAVAMVTLGFFDCRHKYIVVGIFTLGLFFNSCVFAGGLLTPIEISPRYAGFIFSASNSMSAVSGFFAPMVASALTPNGSKYEWNHVFYLGASMFVLCGLIFLIFSSSNVQPWAITRSDAWTSGYNDAGIAVEYEPPEVISSSQNITKQVQTSKSALDDTVFG